MDIDFTIEDRNIYLSEQISQESVTGVIEKIITINESDAFLEKKLNYSGLLMRENQSNYTSIHSVEAYINAWVLSQ